MEDNKKVPNCWADVRFDGDLSLDKMIGLLNSFNQRLAVLEDATYIKDGNGVMKTVTRYYQEESERQMAEIQKKMAEEASKQQEASENENNQ